MFWSGNYLVVKELNLLLKEENVTLTQVLEADDILQECNADNKALIQFLTKPDILSELIGLITEEPPKNVELTSQYRHANIASEVLTSNLSMLRDRLSMDATQMNRLCNFVTKDPPLNPLLASYFSKTIKMLLERRPKQDWCSHAIVRLQVLEFFRSRRDFLPNLLKHISTSGICDTLKCFLDLEDPRGDFIKVVLEWFDEHQFLESLIQIICGTYDPHEAHLTSLQLSEKQEKAQNEGNEKFDSNHNATDEETQPQQDEVVNKNEENITNTNGETEELERPPSPRKGEEQGAGGGAAAQDQESSRQQERMREVAAANAADLLYDIALESSTELLYNIRWCAGREVAARLREEEAVRRLLQGVFTCAPAARARALLHAARVLLALLHARAEPGRHAALERALAPHLPLLHHALLHPPPDARAAAAAAGEARVGAARVAVAALLARLAQAEAPDVPTALVSLGTAGVLLELVFAFPQHNLLHGAVAALLAAAAANARYADRYVAHFLEDCDLLNRLMDAFEENEDKNGGGVRAGYMGHVVALLRALDAAPALGAALAAGAPGAARWPAFRDARLRPLLLRLDTPLGGCDPSKFSYETDYMADTLEDNYDYAAGGALDADAAAGDARGMDSAKNNFLELANERFNDDMWDDAPDDAEAAHDALAGASPWESAGGGAAGGGEEGWAQFDVFPARDPWRGAELQQQSELKQGLQNMHVSGFEDEDKDALTLILAQKMFTAFHNMSPDQDPSHPSHPLDPSHPSNPSDPSDTSHLSEPSHSSDPTHASEPLDFSDPSASSAGDEQR
ncbi:unnamed protein product, partial [Brenthis ino]